MHNQYSPLRPYKHFNHTVAVVTLVYGTTVVLVAGASGEVMKQLHAELMRLAGTVTRYVGVAMSRFALTEGEVQPA